MGGTKPKNEYITRDYPSAVRMSIHAKPKAMVIRLRHLGDKDGVLSEAYLSPEDAYTYAQAILTAYDECLEIP